MRLIKGILSQAWLVYTIITVWIILLNVEEENVFISKYHLNNIRDIINKLILMLVVCWLHLRMKL